MGAVYFVIMTAGAFGYRIPPVAHRRPEGWTSPERSASGMISHRNVHLKDAPKTPRFWLIWLVLCLNVSASIGVTGMASPTLQEIFAGSLVGAPEVGSGKLDDGQLKAIAAGFTGLPSLFNIGSRFFRASLSDRIGRKVTCATFFGLGIALHALAPWAAGIGSTALFVALVGVVLPM